MEDPHDKPSEGFTRLRQRLLSEFDDAIARRRVECDELRKSFFQSDPCDMTTWLESLSGYRNQLKELLGWPLDGRPGAARLVERELLGEKDGLRFHRLLFIRPMQIGIDCVLIEPLKIPPQAVVIGQHGGRGKIEEISGWRGDTANYNHTFGRLASCGIAVVCPQLVLWNEEEEPVFDKRALANKICQIGGSLAALEVARLLSLIDAVLTLPEYAGKPLGMAGLSYGGFYTLLTAALEPRIAAVHSSCYFNNRYRYPWQDWVWKGSATQFLDVELAMMSAPRTLSIEIGRHDALFAPDEAPALAKQIADLYRRLGAEDRFSFRIHDGGHEFAEDDGALGFFSRSLLRD